MMKFKPKSKFEIHWNVNPYDYSQEKQENIADKFSKKYNVRKESVKVIPNFIIVNENGEEISLTKDIIKDIDDPKFQKELFREYINVSGIKDYNLDLIMRIDDEVNDKIDYNKFLSNKRFSLKWLRWSNFLSYGEDNYFDFQTLKGLVLLHGEAPYQNQSGKTTFAIDLTHFLFFGKTTKTETLGQIFNNRLKNATEMKVMGCITIEGEDYVIERVVTRPNLSSRKANSKSSQKVSYYKVVGGEYKELRDFDDVEDFNGESVNETNRIIKEAVGTEKDYDLMLCATSSNLDDLISMNNAERGRLFSRWIGLSCLEEKDAASRALFNSSVKPHLLSNVYNRETLVNEIETLQNDIKEKEEENKNSEARIKKFENDISELEKEKQKLIESKSKVDESLMKVDVNTVELRLKSIVEEGKVKRAEFTKINDRLNELKDVNFDINEYNEVINEKSKLTYKISELRKEFSDNKKLINDLEKGEYCPTCGRKYDNVDNSVKIKEITDRNVSIKNEADEVNKKISDIDKAIESMKENQVLFNEKNQLTIKSSTVSLKIEQLLSEYKEKNLLKENYTKNIEAIKKNNEMEISLRNNEISLSYVKKEYDTVNKSLYANKASIDSDYKEISKRKDIIEKINEEEVLVKNWKIYLDMVGKNGISKMVLRKALPLINADLCKMLDGVCDFTVSVEMTEKQEVIFYIICDGIKSNLNSGSGFEMTCASLALRSVLAKMSTLTKSDYLVLDEILGRVSSANYDNMKLLYDKIIADYKYIIQVTHIDEVRDWHDKILTVRKKDGISSIIMEK